MSGIFTSAGFLAYQPGQASAPAQANVTQYTSRRPHPTGGLVDLLGLAAVAGAILALEHLRRKV